MISNGLGTTVDSSAAVRAVLDQLYATWAAGDADAFAALYTEDAIVVMPGVFHRGRSAVRDYMAAGFAGPLNGSRAVDEPQDIRLLGADTAIVVSTGGVLRAGEQDLPPAREVRATWVLSRQDERWLIAAYANAAAH
jgi:uncharacterized protein (TIGR02246 family)